MKKSLDEVKSEVTVLDRTKQILKDRAGDVDDLLRDLEKKNDYKDLVKPLQRYLGALYHFDAFDPKKPKAPRS